MSQFGLVCITNIRVYLGESGEKEKQENNWKIGEPLYHINCKEIVAYQIYFPKSLKVVNCMKIMNKSIQISRHYNNGIKLKNFK